LAVIQTILLPGIILIELFRIETKSFIQKWVYTFAISLFANYMLITILVVFGLYLRPVVLGIIAFELILTAYLTFKKRIIPDWNFNLKNIKTFFVGIFNQNTKGKKVLVVISSIVVLFYVSLFFSNIATIFYFVDTVNNIHWNTWSMDLSNNMFPESSSHFPQLIPSNWSISHLLIGTPNVHFFPKFFMPLFYLGNLLMMLDLALQKREKVFLIALIIYGFISPIFYTLVFMADGNADVPVSFFAFLSFYTFLNKNTEKFVWKEYALIFLFAATGAATKLAGFYVFLFMSLICLYNLIKNFKLVTRKEFISIIILVIGILSINLFWHFFKPQEMVSGLHQPQWLRSTSYWGIFKDALDMIYHNIGLPVVAFLAITILFSLLTKESRYVTLIFVIPPTLIWMLKYSSDFRNLSFVIPFISFVSAYGFLKMEEILRNGKKDVNLEIETLEIVKNKNRTLLSILLLPVFIALYFLFSSDFVYGILYKIYSTTISYYFGANRIVYLIDGTFFINVDYYQNVISVMFLILFFVTAFSLLNIKLKHLLVILVIAIVTLNFTVIDKGKIIEHQLKGFEEVDARNYYQYVKMFCGSSKIAKPVKTNFQRITYERIEREIKFNYLDDRHLLKYLQNQNKTGGEMYFIKKRNIDKELFQFLDAEIANNNLKIIFGDNEYILIQTNAEQK